MKKLLILILTATACYAQNYVIVTATEIQDNGGAPLASGQICFQGVADNSTPIPFRAGGGGAINTEPVCAAVTAGVMANKPIANSGLTAPLNVAYLITITDNTSGQVISTLGPTQISCSITPLMDSCAGVTDNAFWDLDLFQPGNVPLALIENGPQGIPGPTGPTGPPGTVTATGTGGSFDVPGFLMTGKGPLIDVTEATYGAVHDNTTNDTAAIQAAITFAATIGGTVYYPCGTYLLSSTDGPVVSTPNVSMMGANENCVIFHHTGSGRGLTVQMNPFVSTPAGNYQNFTIKGTSAGAIGLLTGSTVSGTFANIAVDGYTGASAVGIDLQDSLALFPSGGGSWTERNTFLNVTSGGITATNNTIDWQMEVVGGGTNVSFGYNRFINVQANVNSAQTGLLVKSPAFFYNSTLILTCNMADGASFTTNPICVDSLGNADQNLVQLTGEYDGSHSATSIQGTRFVATGSINITNATMNFTGTPSNSPQMRVTSQLDQQTADTGTFTLGSVATTPTVVASDHNGYSNIGLLLGTNINSPFVTMFESAGNRFGVFSVPFGSPLSAMNERWSADYAGNTFQTGNSWINFPNRSLINGSFAQEINGSWLMRGSAPITCLTVARSGAMNLGGGTDAGSSGCYSMFVSATTGINESLGFGDANWSDGFGSVQGVNIAHPIAWGFNGDPLSFEWYLKRFNSPLLSTDLIADLTKDGVFQAKGGYGIMGGPTWTSAGSGPSGACHTGDLFTNTASGVFSVCQSSAWSAK